MRYLNINFCKSEFKLELLIFKRLSRILNKFTFVMLQRKANVWDSL